MQVYLTDEDGYYHLGDLSHLGAVSAVNFEEIASGFLYRQEGGMKARNLRTITSERYVGLERRIRPRKQRDEGERRIGCPRRLTFETRRILKHGSPKTKN